MIIDSLDNASVYETLGSRFAKAFDYLRSGRATTDAVGTHQLDGDNLYVSIQEYNTKPHEKGRWEAHREYADVQFVVSGREAIGYVPLADVTEEQAYNAEDDVAFFTGEGIRLRVPAGTFTVFLPQDVHMPGLAADGQSQPVRKVVVKVRING